jgi:hypothetical protein
MSHTAVGHGSTDHSPVDHGKGVHEHNHMDQEKANHAAMSHGKGEHENAHEGMNHAHMHHMDAERPLFATVTVAVCHCGSGCLLGDLIGEWIVFGTHAQINGREIWVEFLLGKWLSVCGPPS